MTAAHPTANTLAIPEIERRTIGKATRHIVPLMACALLCAYLDRVNIGFAALQMNAELGINNATFGLASSVFALGYVTFAVPSTLMLHKFGARRWIAVLAVLWAIASAATALARNAQELLFIRFLVGAAEAGFSPGAVLYFSTWFPAAYRGRIIGSFLLISPLGFLIGGPLSSLLLSWNGVHGLSGWHWIFIVEAVPSFILAFFILLFLPDKPKDARWLAEDERAWLSARLVSEQRAVETEQPPPRSWSAIADGRVWLFAAVNLCMGTAGIGITIFMPLMIRAMGFSDWLTGFVVAVPALMAGIGLPLWGWWADRARNRSGVVAIACVTMATGLVAAAVLTPSPWAIAALCVALIGYNGAVVALWTLPATFLVGAGAAAGFAVINAAGSMGAITGPALQGWMVDLTGAHNVGLAGLAVVALTASVLVTLAGRQLARAAAS